MNNKWKIIFLDFDGVINGNSPMLYLLYKLLYFLHLYKLADYVNRYDTYGIHKSKIRKLGLICKLTGANVVFTSSWRDKVFESIMNNTESSIRCELIKYYFKKYKITVLDSVPHTSRNIRQEDILSWLSKYENKIEKFIILDDEYIHLKVFMDNLILTSDNTPEKHIQGRWYCREGLRNIHVIKAIKMLKINLS